MKIHYVETRFGFEWGAAKVLRMTDDKKKGWVILRVEAPKHKGNEAVQIYVTKTGKVRIWMGNKEFTKKG